MYKSVVLATVTASVNARTVSMLWTVLEMGNCSLISIIRSRVFL